MDLEQSFIEAIKAGREEEIIDLINKYPDLLDQRVVGDVTPVLFALYYNEPELAKLMIAAGATLDIFSAAAVNDRQALKDILVSRPELVNTVAPDGFQPLGLASFFGAQDTVKLLLEMGAEVNAASQNNLKVTPLHSAVAHQHVDIAKLLLAHGADVNAPQADEFTPLHGAAQNGQLEMVRLLCEHGAVQHAVNAEGLTPLELAMRGGHEPVVNYLRTCLKPAEI